MGSASSIRFQPGRLLISLGLLLVLLHPMVMTRAVAQPEQGGSPQLLPDAAGAPDGESLYLEIILNQVPTGQLGHVVRTGGQFHMPTAALQALAFRVTDNGKWMNLSRLPGLLVEYDRPRQQLRLTAPLELLDLRTQQLNRPRPDELKVQQDGGAIFNYDLFASKPEGQNAELNALSEFRAFGDWGLLTQSQLAFSDPGPGGKSVVRLESAWSFSDPEELTTLQVGDGISRGLPWTRSTRFGGAQWRRNFALQPDLIVYPLPQFYGRADLPSTVELYVNGIRQYQDQVAPGPYEISAVPSVDQLGQATLVVTDPLGRQTVTSLPVYASSQLLEPGFTDYSVELGYVRENFGLKSLDYGEDLMGMATLRHGLSEYFTLEGHAEASEDLAVLGGGAVARLGPLGVFSTAVAMSQHDGLTGRLGRLAYEWRGSWVGFNLDTTQTTDDYHDVASLYGQPPARRADRAFLSLRLGERAGSLTAGYVRLKSQDPGAGQGIDDSRFASLFYTLPLSYRLSFFATVTEDLDDADQTSVYVGLNYAWGGASYALSASRQGDDDRQSFQASRPVPIDGGFGWRALAEHGRQDFWQLESGYRGAYAEINAGVAEFDGLNRVFANLSGAVVAMDYELFLSRRVTDAFAVVSTNGIADVPVLLENREIGRTDSRGYYLLTPLSSYQRNRVSIDPADLPEDVYFGPVQHRLVPADRAGVSADFGLRRRKAATVIVTLPGGEEVPVGSPAYLNGSDEVSGYVGYDGQMYLQDLQGNNRLRIRMAGSRECSLEFAYDDQPGRVPTLGPLTCE